IDRITVNLAPADLRKEGAAFDLPMAVGILCATGLVKPGRLERALVVGELSLDASVRAVRGVLPIALHARPHGLRPLLAAAPPPAGPPSAPPPCPPPTAPRLGWCRRSRPSRSRPCTTRSST